MSEPILTARQRNAIESWLADDELPPGALRDGLANVLLEIDRLEAEMAVRNDLLARVARDDVQGVGEVWAAREREACALLVETGDYSSAVRDRAGNVYQVDPRAPIAQCIRARGPCLPAPPAEGELERLREMEAGMIALRVSIERDGRWLRLFHRALPGLPGDLLATVPLLPSA